jgi:hypothetical protein
MSEALSRGDLEFAIAQFAAVKADLGFQAVGRIV